MGKEALSIAYLIRRLITFEISIRILNTIGAQYMLQEQHNLIGPKRQVGGQEDGAWNHTFS